MELSFIFNRHFRICLLTNAWMKHICRRPLKNKSVQFTINKPSNGLLKVTSSDYYERHRTEYYAAYLPCLFIHSDNRFFVIFSILNRFIRRQAHTWRKLIHFTCSLRIKLTQQFAVLRLTKIKSNIKCNYAWHKAAAEKLLPFLCFDTHFRNVSNRRQF